MSDPFDAFRALETQEGAHALLHDALAQHLAGPAALQEVSAALKVPAHYSEVVIRFLNPHSLPPTASGCFKPHALRFEPAGLTTKLSTASSTTASTRSCCWVQAWTRERGALRIYSMLHGLSWIAPVCFRQSGGCCGMQGHRWEQCGRHRARLWTIALLTTPTCQVHTGVEHDLTAPQCAWLTTLQAAGWDPSAPTLWAAEGLLLYLEQADADAVLQAVTRHSPLGSAWVVQLLTLDSIAAFQKSTFEDNALVKEFRSGVPRDASPYFSSLGWDVAAELGYVGIAAPYLDTPGMQANLALASQLDVDEEDLDSYFRFFVLRRASP